MTQAERGRGAATHDIAWMAEQIGKTPDWIRRRLGDIPHHRIGQSLRFTEQNLTDYLEQTAVRPLRMATTGRRRHGGWAS